MADPVSQGIDVPVGGQVGRNHPQSGARGGVLTVELLGEGQTFMSQTRAGRHDRGPPGEQLAGDRRGDRAGREASDYGHVVGPPNRLGSGRRTLCGDGRDRPGEVGALGGLRRTGPAQEAGPPGGLVGDGSSEPGEPLGGQQLARPAHRSLAVAQASQVLTSRRPPIIDENGAVGVECGGHRPEPAGAQFGVDGLDQGARGRGPVAGVGRNRDPFGQTQGRQNRAGGRGQNAILAGDRGGKRVQGGGIHHSTRGAARARLGHSNTVG